MAMELTIDDVWKLFQETNRVLQESERKWERRMQESKTAWEQRIQETERIMQENHAKTERTVDRVSKQIGDLGGRWGEFVEGLIAPACETLFAQRGILIHRVSRRVTAKLPNNRLMEIDLLVENTDVAAMVEVKSKLKGDHVREYLTRLSEFKEFFPRYADCQVYGAVAGIVVDENVVRYAINQGLFVIMQSGETVRLANEPEFKPRIW